MLETHIRNSFQNKCWKTSLNMCVCSHTTTTQLFKPTYAALRTKGNCTANTNAPETGKHIQTAHRKQIDAGIKTEQNQYPTPYIAEK